MKKLILGALALAAFLPMVGHAQEPEVRFATLAYAWDMDGEPADDNQIVEAAGGVIVDNGTSVAAANYTITAQPDSCRLIDMTISDTNMGVGAGTITVTGTGCLGEAKSCSWSAWTAADDDGVKTLTCTDGKGAYMREVLTITTGVMTGESDEYFLLGYTSNSANAWVAYGRLLGPDGNGELSVDPWQSYPVQVAITTSGVSSTTVTGTAAFTNVAVGDLLLIPLSGKTFERKVTARASANSITVNSAINIPTAGVTFSFKRFFYSPNPLDNLWLPINANETILYNTNVAANVSTGGVVKTLECVVKGPGWPTVGWVTISTDTVATAATGKYADSINTRLLPYNFCRLGLRFGTADDGDGAVEDISLSVSVRKN